MINKKGLHAVLDNHVDKNAVMVTDGLRSYTSFCRENGNQILKIKGGRVVKGIYHIQHVNSYHGRLDQFLLRRHGVSSKYLNNYPLWNNPLNYSNGDKSAKHDAILNYILKLPMRDVAREIADRPAVPVLVA